MTLPDDIFSKLQKLSRDVVLGEYYIMMRDTGYYEKDNVRVEKFAYEIHFKSRTKFKYKLDINPIECENYLKPELVGKFHWLRRWKNYYRASKFIRYDLTLYRNDKMISWTDREQEAKYHHELDRLYRRCAMRIEILRQSQKQKKELSKRTEEDKETIRIKELFAAL